MGKNDVNWDAACELVKADKNRKGLEDLVPVEGLMIAMKKHQVIAAYWMLLTESNGCSGGMESDEMGYGKVYYLCSVSGRMLINIPRLQPASSGLTSTIALCKLPSIWKTSVRAISQALYLTYQYPPPNLHRSLTRNAHRGIAILSNVHAKSGRWRRS